MNKKEKKAENCFQYLKETKNYENAKEKPFFKLDGEI